MDFIKLWTIAEIKKLKKNEQSMFWVNADDVKAMKEGEIQTEEKKTLSDKKFDCDSSMESFGVLYFDDVREHIKEYREWMNGPKSKQLCSEEEEAKKIFGEELLK